MITSVDIEKDLHDRIRVFKESKGVTQRWVIVEALKQYFDDSRIFLDVPEEVRSKLRNSCIVKGLTLNQLVTDILKRAD